MYTELIRQHTRQIALETAVTNAITRYFANPRLGPGVVILHDDVEMSMDGIGYRGSAQVHQRVVAERPQINSFACLNNDFYGIAMGKLEGDKQISIHFNIIGANTNAPMPEITMILIK